MKKLYSIYLLSLIAGLILTFGMVNAESLSNNNYFNSLAVNDSQQVKNDSAEIILKNLSEGEIVYEGKCGKCHVLHEPDEYTQKEWKKILKVMKEKAGLTKEQNTLVLGYLYSKSK